MREPLSEREGVRPRCPSCGYDLTGITSDACPECGSAIDPDRVYMSGVRAALEEWKAPAESSTPARTALAVVTTVLVLLPLIAIGLVALAAVWSGVRVLLLDFLSPTAAGLVALAPIALLALVLAWVLLRIHRSLRNR